MAPDIPRILRVWRVFVASPSDVLAEREQLKEIAGELNVQIAHLQGVHIELLDWREKVVPLMGQPQDVILKQLELENTDLLILILWHRFGTPPGGKDPRTGRSYQSGTEKEFILAYNLWRDTGCPQISVYRCTRDVDPKQVDSKQLTKLQKFLTGFGAGGEHEGLVQEYKSVEDFRGRVYSDLVKLISKSFPSQSPQEEHTQSTPSDSERESDIIPTTATWDDIDHGLLKEYLQDCGKGNLEPLRLEHEESIRQYLCQDRDLLSYDGRYLTRAGALLLCRQGRMPAELFTDVLFYDERSDGGTPPVLDSNPCVYRIYRDVKEYLREANLINADSPGDAPYPWHAVVEALANFLAHREYDRRRSREAGPGRIEITDNCITFINPGHSLIDEVRLKAAVARDDSLHLPQSELRNPNLTSALRAARIGQQQGRGLIRIKQDSTYHGSYFLFISDSRQERFTLCLFRRLSDQTAPLALTHVVHPQSQYSELENRRAQVEQEANRSKDTQEQLSELEGRNQELQRAKAEPERASNEQQTRLTESERTNRELEQAKAELERASNEQEQASLKAGETEKELREYVASQGRSLHKTQRVQRLLLALLLFSLASLGVFGLRSVFGKAVTVAPLQVELGVTENAPPRCNPGGETWSVTLYVRSEGGHVPLKYYWNSQEITSTLSPPESGISFSLDQRNGASIEGTAFVASADGQSGAREIRIEAPSCP